MQGHAEAERLGAEAEAAMLKANRTSAADAVKASLLAKAYGMQQTAYEAQVLAEIQVCALGNGLL